MRAKEDGLTDPVTQAAWVLLAAFVLSFLYELYRATAKAGTSQHDSMQGFAKNNVAFYVVATIVIALLFAGFEWTPWIGLLFSVGAIAASILYYNPKILLERNPGIIDWFEDIVFTGLLSVASSLLVYKVLGITIQP
jgi:phosphatidylserine synthase